MPRSSIIDSEFKGLLGCWSLISSQGDSHLWPFSRQQARCPSILEQLDTRFSTHFTASEHSLLIYWSVSACGGSLEETLCTHSLPHGFFPPLLFSPFYPGMLVVQDAAGIRACRSPIYWLWMCLLLWVGLFVFSFLFFSLFFILSQTLNINPSFLFCPVSLSSPYLKVFLK